MSHWSRTGVLEPPSRTIYDVANLKTPWFSLIQTVVFYPEYKTQPRRHGNPVRFQKQLSVQWFDGPNESKHPKFSYRSFQKGEKEKMDHICGIKGCQRRFKTVYNLEKHRQLHNHTAKYICDECGKRFIEMSSLSNHRRRHTAKRAETVRSHRLCRPQREPGFGVSEATPQPCLYALFAQSIEKPSTHEKTCSDGVHNDKPEHTIRKGDTLMNNFDSFVWSISVNNNKLL